MKEIIKKNRNVLLILIDILIIISCYIASILFLNVPIDNIKALVMQIAVVVIVYQIFLNIFHMYQSRCSVLIGAFFPAQYYRTFQLCLMPNVPGFSRSTQFRYPSSHALPNSSFISADSSASSSLISAKISSEGVGGTN